MGLVRFGITCDLFQSVIDKKNNKSNLCALRNDINLSDLDGNCIHCNNVLLTDNGENNIINKCTQCNSHMHNKCYSKVINKILSEFELMGENIDLLTHQDLHKLNIQERDEFKCNCGHVFASTSDYDVVQTDVDRGTNFYLSLGKEYFMNAENKDSCDFYAEGRMFFQLDYVNMYE